MKTKTEVDPWEVEDFLQSFIANGGARVFHKMRDEKTSAHSDSYGTCLSFTAFDEAFKASPFNKEQWIQCCAYWLKNDCAGVPLKIIANMLKRTL
jgi:hypothetical protein